MSNTENRLLREKAVRALRPVDQQLMKEFFKDRDVAGLVISIATGKPFLLDEVETERKVDKDDGGFEILDVFGIQRTKQSSSVGGYSIAHVFDLELNASYISPDVLGGRILQNVAALAGTCGVRAKFYANHPDASVIFVVSNDALGGRQMVRRTDWDPVGLNHPRFHSAILEVKAADPALTDAVLDQDGRLVAELPELLKVAEGREGDPRRPLVAWLAHDLVTANPDDMHFQKMKERMQYFKETREGESIMNTALQELEQACRAEGKAEGRAEGKVEGKAEGIVEGIEKGVETTRLQTIRSIMSKGWDLADAMSLAGYPLEEASKYEKLLASS